jgi:mono/diheme cytochrome c family protein
MRKSRSSSAAGRSARVWMGIPLGMLLLAAGCASAPGGEAAAAGGAGASPSAAGGAAASGAASRTVMAGVFTGAQATRGQQRFTQTCASCHAVSEFSGPMFQRIWTGRSVGDLYEVMSTLMPLSDPGSLSPQEYTDIITYFLRQNGYPEGAAELAPERRVLDSVTFEPAR